MTELSQEIKQRLIGLKSSYQEPYPVQVRGEEQYQDNLEKICDGPDEAGYDDDSHQAALYLEDTNSHDSNAVRVEINDFTVGYLSRSDAKKYREQLAQLKAPENAIAICGASIRGGFYKEKTNEWAPYGVRLDFYLDELELTDLRFQDNAPDPAPKTPSTMPLPESQPVAPPIESPKVESQISIFLRRAMPTPWHFILYVFAGWLIVTLLQMLFQ